MLGTRPGEIPGVKEADEVGKDFLRQLQVQHMFRETETSTEICWPKHWKNSG